MKFFCWHKWQWHSVQRLDRINFFQPGWCVKCGKARIRWLGEA